MPSKQASKESPHRFFFFFCGSIDGIVLFDDVEERHRVRHGSGHITPVYSEVEIAFIMRELLEALRHVHEAGVIHCDVKAENVMVVYRAAPGAYPPPHPHLGYHSDEEEGDDDATNVQRRLYSHHRAVSAGRAIDLDRRSRGSIFQIKLIDFGFAQRFESDDLYVCASGCE